MSVLPQEVTTWTGPNHGITAGIDCDAGVFMGFDRVSGAAGWFSGVGNPRGPMIRLRAFDSLGRHWSPATRPT